MPAIIEFRCPRCRRDYPRDRFGETPAGGRATLCLGCAARPRRRPTGTDWEANVETAADPTPTAHGNGRFGSAYDEAPTWG